MAELVVGKVQGVFNSVSFQSVLVVRLSCPLTDQGPLTYPGPPASPLPGHSEA